MLITPQDTEQDIVNPQTLEFRRACKDSKEANQICKRMLEDNRNRADREAKILKKYNGDQPFPQASLNAAGQKWRSNRDTGFLSSMIARAMPPYKQTIDRARMLTGARLPEDTADADQKSEWFQQEFTRCVRGWDEWNDVTHSIIFENVLFGRCACYRTDEISWKFQPGRSDEVIFPDACPQHENRVPYFMVVQRFLVHELARHLAEPEVSAAAGWNIKNLVKAVNSSKPENRSTGISEDARRSEDAIREASTNTTSASDVRVIEAYHLLIKEPSGTVSHFLTTKDGDELMTRLDRFEAMSDCLVVFTLEVGNGKLYGSKGAGRVLYNTHVSVERARNLILDNLYLSGLVLLTGKPAGKQTAAITVAHPICVVGDGYQVVDKAKFEVNVDAFFQMDRHMVSLAEQQIGIFMPGQQLNQEGEKRTASEVNYVASIDQQIREGVINRFWGQFQRLAAAMARAICSEANIMEAMRLYDWETANGPKRWGMKILKFLEKLGRSIVGAPEPETDASLEQDAIQCCLRMLRLGLKPEEILAIANGPAQETNPDTSAQDAAALQNVAARYLNSPFVNQQELAKMDLQATVGNARADMLLNPVEDQTDEIEATTKQLLELGPMLAGEKVGVSGRDNHLVHLKVLTEKAQQVMGGIDPQMANAELLGVAHNIMAHYADHLAAATASGLDPQQIAEYTAFAKGAEQLMGAGESALSTSPAESLQMPQGAVTPADMPPSQDPLADPASMPLSRGPVDMSVQPQ